MRKAFFYLDGKDPYKKWDDFQTDLVMVSIQMLNGMIHLCKTGLQK
jgi:hypothetical protein